MTTNKKIIYFDQVFGDFKNILFEHKPEGFDLLFWDEMTADEREKLLPVADYLLVATQKIDDSIIAKAKNAKLIQKTGIGVDNIDIESTNVNGIPVSNTPGGNATGVAELTILLILSLYRKLPYVNRETKAGKWLMWEVRPTSYELEGKTHGFIGFGMIGREAAKRSKAFGTNIVYYDKFRASKEYEDALEATYLSLEEVLQQSDVISLHLPLLPDTKGLIGQKELSMMKGNAVLINVSRGGIVKEDALYQALTEGVIAGAGIDVWETEPTDPTNPLLTLENVIASPHIGAGTRDTLNRVLKIAFDNIVRVDNGDNPQYVVNNTIHISK
ncbi:2-hydroxyacid dehydrogenase [Bacillus pinisoli]|uniref:2-hydroxyacid dehydrogenase n=1 Tax=Bacillus pinisoli TaxID=2901866 RepID=UPI001FF60AE3|nr:2-hydroxyacid dehydrogenase [Bacillus pinisoli]